MRKHIITASGLVLTTVLAGCSPEPADHGTPDTSAVDTMKENGDAMSATTAGTYISFEEYEKHKDSIESPVLFFNASWCPLCRQMDEKFSSDPSLIPDDITLVDVDYDSHEDLRQAYGVTMQHTFVKLGGNGKVEKVWSGSDADALKQGLGD